MKSNKYKKKKLKKEKSCNIHLRIAIYNEVVNE